MSEIEWNDNGQTDLGGEFGFEIKRPNGDRDYWKVSLPHQCDDWSIAGGYSTDLTSHADVVAGLERFIAEARAALVALRAAGETT